MSVQESIEEKLAAAFAPAALFVENESAMHRTAKGAETHFKVLVISATFEGKSLLDRQRAVYAVLRDELSGGVHALSVRALTEGQYAAGEAQGFVSPRCASSVKPREGA